ncbi:hypothetical protein [Streptomyces sp. R35]|uniref:Major facilitator superfamily (MFS) profile domain-containing protein n=1 Tax=Streptomyces sp. R35 TaxID=3238630 RepID=A0AB39SMB6_9ACTN
MTAAFSVGVPDLATQVWNCSTWVLSSFAGAFLVSSFFASLAAPVSVVVTALSLLLVPAESEPLLPAVAMPMMTNRTRMPPQPRPAILPTLRFFGGWGAVSGVLPVLLTQGLPWGWFVTCGCTTREEVALLYRVQILRSIESKRVLPGHRGVRRSARASPGHH